MALRAFCMKYFRVLNSRAVSTTGWPLRRTSCDDKSTTTSPKTITLSVLVALKWFTAWPNRPSSLVDSEVSVRGLLSDISRTASFFIVDLSIRTRTGTKRERLRISFELMVRNAGEGLIDENSGRCSWQRRLCDLRKWIFYNCTH